METFIYNVMAHLCVLFLASEVASEARVQKGGDIIMENVLNKYETDIVIDASLTDDEINVIVEKFKALITANGTVDSVDVWGKRKLAYPIDYKTEGYYVLINFTSQAEFIKELDRNYNITDGILRTLTVRK